MRLLFRWLYVPLLVLGVIACGHARASAAPLKVAVELYKLTPADVQSFQILSLHRKLLGRLLQADFAILAARHKVDLRLGFRALRGNLILEAKGAGKTITRNITRARRDMAQYHLEVVHKSISILRRLRLLVQKQRRKPEVRVVKQTPGLKIVRMPRTVIAPKERPNPWRAEIEIGALLLHRLQGADFHGRMGLRIGRERGFGIYLGGFLSPSIADAITILEWGLQLGPTWRQPISTSFSLEFGLLAGFLHHLYYFGLGGEGQDGRLDFVGSLVVLGNWHITRVVGLRLWLGLGMTTKGRVHRLDNVVIWTRSLLRLQAGLALTLAF